MSSDPEDTERPSAEGDKTISVVMLGGDSTVLEYQPHLTISSLKDFVKRRLGPDPDKQRLLYKEQELKVGLIFPDTYDTILTRAMQYLPAPQAPKAQWEEPGKRIKERGRSVRTGDKREAREGDDGNKHRE